MKFNCVERRVASLFGRHARFVTRHPLPFIAVPVLLTICLSMGFIRHRVIKDELTLYAPTDAKARRELSELEHYFRINDSDLYYATRRYDVNRAGYVIVKAEASDVLNPKVIRATIELWEEILKITVKYNSVTYRYEDICVRFPITGSNQTACVSNPLIAAYKQLDASNIPNATKIAVARLRYPVTSEGWFIGPLIGGITLNTAKYVTGAKAFLLPYQLRHSTPLLDIVAEKWELRLSSFFKQDFASNLVQPHWWTYETLASESSRDREQLVVMMRPMVVAITVFTIACCCVGSWVRSRPWLGLSGVISAGMAILSAVGTLLAIGVPFTSVAYSMPFIVFSIGVDNVFILLSAWRKTPTYYGLTKRMSLAWRDAGVSITVTSLTDGLSFSIGAMTTFPSVRIFCIYATVAVIFVYVYQLTFFAGIMVLTSRRELDGKHCLTFRRIESPKFVVQDCGKLGKQSDVTRDTVSDGTPSHHIWAMVLEKAIGNGGTGGGRNSHHAKDESLKNNHLLARFFRSAYADLLLNPIFRILAIASFFLYLGVAVWGCTRIQLGLQPYNLVPDDSYAKDTMRTLEKYFTESGSYLHVYIRNLEPLHKDGGRIWIPLQKEIELYEHTEFTGYSDSWLRMFMAYANAAGLIITPDNFIYLLKNVFLEQEPYRKYERDVRFDSTGSYLSAVRFPVHMRYVGATNHSRAMDMFRRLADSSQLNVGVYSEFFLFAEQYNAVLPGTLTNIGVAGAAVIIVSLLLIPQPLAAFWVSLTIASINVGIMGYMSFWGVRLDFISMVTIVMSIGFCVDFSAHIAYHFAKEADKDSSERLRLALYAVGTPIVQSALSTILGVCFMVTVDSYVFRSFLKTIILVIILGALHGLVILPVLLTLLYCNTEHEEEEDDSASGQPSTESTSSSANQQRTPPRDSRSGDGVAKAATTLDLLSDQQPIPTNISAYPANAPPVTMAATPTFGNRRLWNTRQSAPPPLPSMTGAMPPHYFGGNAYMPPRPTQKTGRNSMYALNGNRSSPQTAAGNSRSSMYAAVGQRHSMDAECAAAIYDNPLVGFR